MSDTTSSEPTPSPPSPERDAATPPRPVWTRRRLASLAIFVVGAAVAVSLDAKAPKDQPLRFVLGDAAPRVVELQVRYAPTSGKSGTSGHGAGGDVEEIARDARFRYSGGTAPRIVSHNPRLADGEYVVEVELITAAASATLSRRVALAGFPVSIDLAESVPK